MQLPSVLWAHGSFGHSWEQSEAPDTRRGSGRACSSPPRKKARLFRGHSARSWAVLGRWKAVSAVFPIGGSSTFHLMRTCRVPASCSHCWAALQQMPPARAAHGRWQWFRCTCSWGRQHILIVWSPPADPLPRCADNIPKAKGWQSPVWSLVGSSSVHAAEKMRGIFCAARSSSVLPGGKPCWGVSQLFLKFTQWIKLLWWWKEL